MVLPLTPQKRSSFYFFDWPLKHTSVNSRRFGIFLFLSSVFIFVCYTQISISSLKEVLAVNATKRASVEKYLIHTSKCRIPDDDPFNEEVKKFIHREEYTRCTKQGLLSYIERGDDAIRLRINGSLLGSYSLFALTCCYSEVIRVVEVNKTDSKVKYGDCKGFNSSADITGFATVRVLCKNHYGAEVYANVHTVIDKRHIDKEEAKMRIGAGAFSAIFVGIDSISKMNLVRTMPKAHRFLETHDFINLRGYTKIGDNTFPNLMGILSGMTSDQAYDVCDARHKVMDTCDIIWYRFRKLGYVTAYAEDESGIGTFHYYRNGFKESPTDFYFRPYVLATEELSVVRRHGMKFCTGPENTGVRIMNLAKDFLVNTKEYAKFGLFWMNSFSHDNLNIPSAMDDRVHEFLMGVYPHLENTIFIFFSDHGFRFGDIRYTHTGWLEERLPFIYIHIPNSFKEQFPEAYNNFVINSERLTNPYDVYMTLQDVLRLANESSPVLPSQACPKCQSLFREVDEKRTCQDAAIEQHWCMCTGHSYVNPKKQVVQDTAHFIIDEVNRLIRPFAEGDMCSYYYVKKIVSAGMSEAYLNALNQSVNYFLLMIETRPPAMFEATVEADLRDPARPAFRLLGEISRVNRYAENSFCVKDAKLKKYCYCDGLFTSIKSAICNFLNCI